MNDAPQTDGIEAGRLLFSGFCDFMASAPSMEVLPSLGPMEIAFCGRSNVGKSSLVNALTGRKALARTSHTPGRTQELNFFAVGSAPPAEKMRLIDMPGYGYAAVSKTKVESWTNLARAYVQGRPTLARVFVLVDGRHGLKEGDLTMFGLLDAAAVSYQVILTKADEVKQAERAVRLAATHEALSKLRAAHPLVLFTSSRTGEDVALLRAEIADLLRQRG